ncbi:MAG: oligosaccharide flippase family protein [Bacteroidetes bacterium]|nr:oligosaccharide flippase family protein [Bacteroidota bacterium]
MAKRRFLRDTIGVFNSNVFSIICGLLVVIMLTRLLGVEGFGLYYALLVIPIIVVSLTHLGIRGASIYMIGQKKFSDNEIVSSVIFILVFTSILGILSSIGAYYFFYETEYTVLLISMVIIIIPFRLAVIYIGGIFFGKDEIKQANRFEWTINLINFIFAAALVWSLNLGLFGAIISISVANVFVGLWGLYIISKKFNICFQFIPKIIKQMLMLGIMYAFTFFIIQLNYRVDILLLEKLSTIHEVGIYSLGAHIAEQLWQIPLAISIVLFSRTANMKDHSLITQSTISLARLSFVLIFLLSLAVIFVAPYIIPFVFGDEFSPSIDILQLILPGVIILVIFRVLSGQLAGMGKPYLAVYVFAPALIINILLNFLWIPEYGGKGAAWASDISYAVGTIGYWIIYSRVLNVHFFEILKFKKTDISIFVELKTKLFQKWKI